MICSAGVSPAASLGEIKYTYDNIDRKTRVDYPNGAATTYSYELLTGWLDVITHYDASNAVILRLAYERDLTGLITDLDETRHGEITRWKYTYDDLKRLETAVQTAQNGAQLRAYAYKYDRNGNRLEKSVTIGPAGTTPTVYAYSHNRLDQLRTEHENGAVARTYEWDAVGRLTRELTSTGAVDRAYAWSVDDRLQGVQLPNNQTITYDYDHRGSRVSRTEGSAGLTTRRMYLADYENLTNYSQILAETDAAGTHLHRNYVFGPDHGAHFQGGADPGSPAFLHGDNLGTTRDLTSPAGLAIADASFTYSPFGDPTSGDSSLTNYRFTGQFREEGTGLQWHRARWLGVSETLWLAADTLCDFPLNFASEYGYGGQSPLSSHDPGGEFTKLEILAVSAIVAILVGISFFSCAGRPQSPGMKAIGTGGAFRTADFGIYIPSGEIKNFPTVKNMYVAPADGFYRIPFQNPVDLSQFDVLILSVHGGFTQVSDPWITKNGEQSRSVIKLADGLYSPKDVNRLLISGNSVPIVIIVGCGIGRDAETWRKAFGAKVLVYADSDSTGPYEGRQVEGFVESGSYEKATEQFLRSFFENGRSLSAAVYEAESIQGTAFGKDTTLKWISADNVDYNFLQFWEKYIEPSKP